MRHQRISVIWKDYLLLMICLLFFPLPLLSQPDSKDEGNPGEPEIPYNTADCDGHGDAGDLLVTVVCDGAGDLVACVYTDNFGPPEYPGPGDPGHEEIVECVRRHEEHHASDGRLDCDNTDAGEIPTYPNDDDWIISECEAHAVEIFCLDEKIDALQDEIASVGVPTLEMVQALDAMQSMRQEALDYMGDAPYNCFDPGYPGDANFFQSISP